MYGAGNPQMAALGALGALGGSLRDMAMSPVRNWSQASLSHKIIAAGAGAGLAYYLHKRGMGDATVAALGVGGAYATSVLMHSRQMVSQDPGALANGQAAGVLPSSQVQDMAAQANAVMNGSGGANGQWSALGPSSGAVAPQQPPVTAPVPPAPTANTGVGGSQWAALG
ncbi:MAG: hypothetical protein ACYSWO_19865 [Planctomycetota bacterium]|jgi:hypothetical protein